MADVERAYKISAITLSFDNPNLEKSFAAIQVERLNLTLRWWLGAVFVLLAINIFFLHAYWNTGQYETAEQVSASMYQLIYQCVFVGQMLVALLVALVLGKRGRLGARGMEVTVVVSSSILVGSACLHYKHYFARALGHEDTSAFWGVNTGGQDANILLAIDVCLTTLHLMIPIRWKFLWPVEVISILAYAIPAYALGSPDSGMAANNLVVLTSLVVLAALGKRALEHNERLLFLTLMREKRMRVEAEFRADQTNFPPVRGGGRRSRDIDDESILVPSDTGTGQVFRVNSENVISFDQMVELGRKEQWLIEEQEVQLIPQILGAGAFGVVARGKYQGTQVAVKTAQLAGTRREEKGGGLLELCNELRILRRLRHPRIVFLYGAVLKPNGDGLCLVLELIDGEPLGRFLQHRISGESSVRLVLLTDIASALRYLHSRQPAVVHGDLKDNNIFVERSHRGVRRAKLLDFGLSRQVTRSSKRLGGTLRWVAPEVLSGGMAREGSPRVSADVFSFGRVTYLVATGQAPFANITERKLRSLLKRQPILHWPEGGEGTLVRLVRPVAEQCMQHLPKMRPSMEDVCNMLRGVETELGEKNDSEGTPSSGSGDGPPAELSVFTEFKFARGSASFPATVSMSLSSERLDGIPEENSPHGQQTPSSTENSAGLDSADAAESLPASVAHRPSRHRPLHSSLEPTSKEMMCKSLGLLMMQWNFDLASGSCCWLHAALNTLETIKQEIWDLPCDGWDTPVGGQCSSCGLLWIESDSRTCLFCGSEISE